MNSVKNPFPLYLLKCKIKPPDVHNNAIHCEGKKQIRHLSQMLCGKVNLIFVCGLTWAVKGILLFAILAIRRYTEHEVIAVTGINNLTLHGYCITSVFTFSTPHLYQFYVPTHFSL